MANNEKENAEIVSEIKYLEQLRRVHLSRTRKNITDFIKLDTHVELQINDTKSIHDRYSKLKKILDKALISAEKFSEDPKNLQTNGF